ncbi:hypothetical protein R6Q57_019940 [Mikania cordata]
MEPTPVHTLNLKGVLSVSKKIILDRYWHFVTLSLFFLPLCFFLTILPTFDYQKLQISHLIYIIIVYIISVCAVGTITYSTHHAFFGSPVKISDALMSLISSFFRLALTAIIAHVLIVLISLTFLMLVGTLFMLANRLWFVIDYNSTYFMWCSVIACVILIAIILHVNVEWSLAFVVVVVESRWGFAEFFFKNSPISFPDSTQPIILQFHISEYITPQVNCLSSITSLREQARGPDHMQSVSAVEVIIVWWSGHWWPKPSCH